MARGRGLGDVLHFFIPEDEQRGALERASRRAGSAASAPRWCLLADPRRPARCALAVDLAAALTRSSAGVGLLSPFAREPVLPRAAEVHWETCGDIDGEPHTLLRRLEAQPEDRAVLLLAAPTGLRALLEHPAARALDGVLVPVDATARGVARALGWLGSASGGLERMRIGALLVGAIRPEEGDALGEQFARSARRELGLEVHVLGNLERDESSYRSLLHGRSVVELDSASRASSSLRALVERLARWRGAPRLVTTS